MRPQKGEGNAPCIDLSQLLAAAAHFLGRGPELIAQHTALDPVGNTAVVAVIAPGGIGYPALLKRCLDGQLGQSRPGAG